MATYTAPGIVGAPHRAGATGNVSVAVGQILGRGDGSSGTVVAGSVLNMLQLPRGCRIVDMIIIGKLDTASLTISAGYSDVAGVNAAVADAFVVAATSLATAATFVRKNNPALPTVELANDMSNLTITTAGATSLATNIITMIVFYNYAGTH